MKKLLFATLLIVFVLSLTSCNLSQGTRTLPAPGAASPTLPPVLSVSPSPAAVESATPKVVPTNPVPSKTAPASATPAKATLPPAPSATQPQPTATATIDASYPADPDGVVQAFVTGYPDNTAEMLRYLSSSLKAALPKGGPAILLKIQGDINGFAIVSGSQTPKPSEAIVTAAMLAGGSKVQRTFSLIKENNYWVINSIN